MAHWEFFKQQRVDHAEYGRVCSDANRQRQDGHNTEARVSFQPAQGITQILSQMIQPEHALPFIEPLFSGRDATKPPDRGKAGIAGVHTFADKPLRFEFDVGPDLLTEILSGAFTPEPHRFLLRFPGLRSKNSSDR